MKRRKIIGLIACIVLIACLTGCAEFDSALNDLQGNLTGNTYTINTYDNYGNKIMTTQGEKINIEGNAVKSTSYDSNGSVITGYELSSVITINIDGKEIHSVTAESLRKNIGIVQQDIYLFNASIKENILYGKLDATDEEVIEAAKRANIHDYIMSLEKGYDTQIGERGVRLSGGQAQRLALARTLAHPRPVLILDDPFSALDRATEDAVFANLRKYAGDKTVFLISHRLYRFPQMQKIIFMEDGETTVGTHVALMASVPAYKRLYESQTGSDVHEAQK